MKKVVIIVVGIIVVFFLAIGISYKIVNKGKKPKEENNEKKDTITSNVDIYTSSKETKVNNEEKFEEINKDSALAQELLEFVPKSFQTYPGKLNEDYIVYEALSRISKEKESDIEIKGMPAYKFDDVDKKVKEIYGQNISAVKKEIYASPVEYFSDKDAFCIYPVGIDNTDNKMLVKSAFEGEKSYKLIVYSICIYMDVENENKIYLVTKDTIRKYYQLISRNDKSIKSTYKEYTMDGTELNLEDVVKKYGDELPQIEYDLVKIEDENGKYYVSNIKDIY